MRDAIYHSTYTGKPPDEPAVLGLAMNELFIPCCKSSFLRSWTSTCPRRLQLPHGRGQHPQGLRRPRAARDDGRGSHLRQFMYTKFIVVVDDDVDVRDWKEVIWAITTRMHPARDTMVVENTPIDYLDFCLTRERPGQQDGDGRHEQNGPGKPSANGVGPCNDAEVSARAEALMRGLEPRGCGLLRDRF